jgi:RNA polymerase sigma-70 factor (ECF subfamily)
MIRFQMPVDVSEMVRTYHNNTDTPGWQAQRDGLYRFVLKRVHDEAAAEDIVQDVIFKAYTRRGTLKEPSKLQPWLYQITRNAIIDYFRAQKSLIAVSDDLLHDDTPELENSARMELARCLLPMLDELPVLYRQAVKLAEFEGATQREVASRLGLSLSGAKSRVQRGRKKLRETLLKCCLVELDSRGGVMNFESQEGCNGCSGPTGT